MAITVHAVQKYESTSAATSHTIPLNTLGLTSGDRVIVFASTGKNQLSPGHTWPGSPWNELSDTVSTEGNAITHSTAYRDISGSPPTSVQLNVVNAADCSAWAVRISGHDPAAPPEVATAINTPVDPPSLSPSWGSSTFLALCSLGTHDDPFPFPSYPLTDTQNLAAAGATRTYICTQSVTGSSVNPAAWISGPEPSGYNVVTMAVKEASSGHNVAMGQVGETDSIQNVLPIKYVAMGQLTESDSLLSVAPNVAHIISQQGEIDTLGTLVPIKVITLTQLVETDTVNPFTSSKTKQLGQLSETETVQALSAIKAVALAQLNEGDTLQNLLGTFELLEILTEVDSLLPLLPVKLHFLPQLQEGDFLIQLGGADEITQGATVGAPDGFMRTTGSSGLVRSELAADSLQPESLAEPLPFPALGRKASSETGLITSSGASGLEPSYD